MNRIRIERTPGGQPISWMAWLDGGFLALAAPFLLFPSRWPAATVASLTALVVIWLLRWAVEKVVWPATPFNGALLLFCLTVGVGIAVTPLPDPTLPKATGLFLGLAAFRFIALWVTNQQRFVRILVIFCLVGLGVLVVGLLGTDWGAKIPALQQVLDRLPRMATQLPDAPDAGISPNQLAGALILYLPLAALGAVAWRPGGRYVGLWLLTLAGLAILLGVLILTQSRGGWMGGVAGLFALVVLAGFSVVQRWARWSAFLALVVVLFAAIGAVFLLGGAQAVGDALYGKGTQSALEETVGAISIEGRIEIWSRALYAIADFPFTGCGLGTFREVAWLLYPPFLVTPGTDFAHAHNIFLQTALDLGLVGLVAYLALLGVAGTVCWQVARRGDLFSRYVALGLASGLVGLHIYGLTDALALGSKPGLAFWMALGLIAALSATIAQQEPANA